MTDAQKQAIQQDAERAAQERQTPNEKCPHPFSSEQGRYWVACYRAAWDRLHGAMLDPDDMDRVYQEERMAK